MFINIMSHNVSANVVITSASTNWVDERHTVCEYILLGLQENEWRRDEDKQMFKQMFMPCGCIKNPWFPPPMLQEDYSVPCHFSIQCKVVHPHWLFCNWIYNSAPFCNSQLFALPSWIQSTKDALSVSPLSQRINMLWLGQTTTDEITRFTKVALWCHDCYHKRNLSWGINALWIK